MTIIDDFEIVEVTPATHATVHYMKGYLNASEVARLLKVDRATVTRWIKRGIIKHVLRPEGTQNYRIPISAYEELLKKRNT